MSTQRFNEKDGGDGLKEPLDALANANGLNQRGRHPSMDSFKAFNDPLSRATNNPRHGC